MLFLAAFLAIAPLQFLDDGRVFISLGADGRLQLAERPIGRLSPDGRFTFDHSRVTAVLGDEGRVVITAPPGADLKRLPGDLGRTLKRFHGRLESGYTIDADGTATIPLSEALSFDADGRLSNHGLVVKGLTPKHRRTAMFIYVLLSTIIP